jgi:hypothetical protein
MPSESTDSWQDIAPDTADEVADSQGFVEGVLREGLDDPLINQGYEYKDSLFLADAARRCSAVRLMNYGVL